MERKLWKHPMYLELLVKHSKQLCGRDIKSWHTELQIAMRSLLNGRYDTLLRATSSIVFSKRYLIILGWMCGSNHWKSQVDALQGICKRAMKSMDYQIVCRGKEFYGRLENLWENLWRGDLMVSELDPGSSRPCSSSGWGHCVVFLGKTLDSHSASLHPGV